MTSNITKECSRPEGRIRYAEVVVAEHRTGGISANRAALHEMYRSIRNHFGWGYMVLAFLRVQLSSVPRRFRRRPPPHSNTPAEYNEPGPPSAPRKGSVAVVTVTHDSGAFVPKLVVALEAQTQPPDMVVLVDSGSSNPQYLDRARNLHLSFVIVLDENIGFAKACNLGWDLATDHDFVLFLNPDAFLTPEYLEKAVEFMEAERHQKVGILTGTLLGYDIAKDLPTGLVDSTGIQQTWFGRFYDRDQGKPESALLRYKLHPNPVQAICGAAMFARQTALSSVSRDGAMFQPDFFMYKEDIDLSLRVAHAGWTLMHHPGLTAFHCRGWKSRKAMPKSVRVLSARNEIRMHYRSRSPFVILSILKLCLVMVFETFDPATQGSSGSPKRLGTLGY